MINENRFFSILSGKTKLYGTGMVAIAVAWICFLSCSKKDDPGTTTTNDVTKFIGSYTMSSSCWTAPRTVIVAANGSSTTSILLPLSLSEGTTCYKLLSVPVNVSGNNIQTTTNTVQDACNAAFTETISGSVNGNTLTLTYVTVNSLGVPYTCNFVGPKQ